MVQIYNTNMNMKTMVWGVFWDYGRSNLYIIDRDFKSKKHGYSAESYLEVLEAEISLIFEDLEPGYEFIQDNIFIYIARKVKAWFLEYNIPIILN
jgi:hypothetical protein